ncbi:hypothetical protein GNF66_14965 [Clostridium perfringens]|nr:hypothetical protein [Clostridium perfringens]
MASLKCQFMYNSDVPTYPVININGNGNIRITINGETMNIDNVVDKVTIDSKLMQVRNKDGASKDNETNGNFPYFDYGINTVELSGNITNAEIKFTTNYKG